jgi:hypothetical protein
MMTRVATLRTMLEADRKPAGLAGRPGSEIQAAAQEFLSIFPPNLL